MPPNMDRQQGCRCSRGDEPYILPTVTHSGTFLFPAFLPALGENQKKAPLPCGRGSVVL